MRVIPRLLVDDASLVSSNVPETLPEYDGGATYALGYVVRDEATHHAFESLVADNIGNALTDESKWLDLGATNRWKLFDDRVGTITEAPEELDYTLRFEGQRVMAIALGELDAAEVEITATDDVDGVFYHEIVSTVSYDNVLDYWDYFFAPLIRKRKVLFEGLAPYAGATIRIQIRTPGGIPKCGTLVAGELLELGGTRWGMRFGQIDHSVKKFDDFGNAFISVRPARSTAGFAVEVDPGNVDETMRVFNDLRARPSMWIGTNRFGAAMIFGWPSDVDMRVNHLGFAELDTELEGLN